MNSKRSWGASESRRMAWQMVMVLTLCALGRAWAAGFYQEPLRPQYHFTPPRNWMNDPNGMVFFEGEYHLFYQYNPHGDKWGHMSWGHAVSEDMVHWDHLAVALKEENDTMIFSGSVVVDWKNTSGLGERGKPPLVAIYTGHHTRKPLQHQNLAYSTDRGRSWKKFGRNPVLDIGAKDFRDPKVFWHEPTRRWVMAVALPTQRRIRFYSSPDLKNWITLSEFGRAGSRTGIWECPDLFPLRVRGGEERWVLMVSVGSGAPAGGSGMQYFVGDFDGKTFKLDRSFPKGQPEFVPEPSLVVEFEREDYGRWETTGDAFANGPARGSMDQLPIEGYRGERLVNSFRDGDQSQGTLTSGEFELEDKHASFLIGGGNHPGKTCINLLIGTNIARTATGDNSDQLTWKSWDIQDLKGKRARFQIVDLETNDWGHILVDHIILSETPASPAVPEALWVDYGPDFYAAVSWSDIPKRDGRRIWLGWMNNWKYANDIPTFPWRGAMSLPRELILRSTPSGPRLAQAPIEELQDLRTQKSRISKVNIAEANNWLREKNVGGGDLWEMEVLFESANVKTDFGLRLFQSTNQMTVVTCDTATGGLSLDRTRSGRTDFHPSFSGVYRAPLPSSPDGTRLHVFLDSSSVEIFANNGQCVMTSLLVPRTNKRPLEFWSSNKALVIYEINLWRLKPAVPIQFGK